MGPPSLSLPQQRDIQRPEADTHNQKVIKRMALIIVVACGILPRLNHIDKSIWTPEAWVANSVLTETLGQMFCYKDWLQTSPPLFLLLLHWTVRVAGVSVASFRAVPLAFSILSLIVIAWLAQKLLRTPFAVMCSTLIVLSPPAVVFSKEVKQFTADMAATCVLLVVCWQYTNRPNRRNFLLLCTSLTLALFLSYPAVTFIPVAIFITAVTSFSDANGNNNPKHRLHRAGLVAILAGAICALNYWFFVKPNTSALLTHYWDDGYPTFNSIRRLISFYVRNFLGLGIYFYLPISSKDSLGSKLVPSSAASLLLVWMVAIVILVASLVALRSNQQHVKALALCLGPILCLAFLNALRLYPASSRRLTLFLLPCISLATAIILQNIWDTVSVRLSASMAERLSIMATFTCLSIVLIAATHSDHWGNYWFEDEDTAGAFRYLRSHAAQEDTIYVHASIEEPVKLYVRILQWSPRDLRYGNTGHPCCTRTPDPILTGPESQRQYVLHDFQQVMSLKPVRRLWLISTGRTSHWENLGRNELEIIDESLILSNCHKNAEEHFAYETVQEFVCANHGLSVVN